MKISRDEALKAVDDLFNYCEEIDNSLPENEKSGYEMLPDIHKIRKYIIENEKPLVEWIPCSERLPKPNELVVASLKTGVQLCEYLADGSSDSWLSLTDNRFVFNRLIKAWMPLPEPYMKEGEKE